MIHILVLFGVFLGIAQPVIAQDILDTHRFGFRDDSLIKGKTLFFDPFDFRSVPVPFHGFLIMPVLNLEQSYISNIRAVENDENSDFVSSIEPALRLEKSFGPHSLAVTAAAEIRRYWSESDENTAGFKTALEADIKAGGGFSLPVRAGYERRHAARARQRQADPSLLTEEPVEIETAYAETGAIYRGGRFILKWLGRYEDRRYEDGRLRSGSPAIRRDRDHIALQTSLYGAYETRTGWRPFISTLYRQEDYKRRLFTGSGFNGQSRDNSLWRSLAGLSFNYKGLLYGKFGAGYESRNYDQAALGDTNSFSLQAILNWEPVQKMRLRAELNNKTEEDNLIATGLETFFLKLQSDYELRRDIFSRITASYEMAEFLNTVREDKTYTAGLEFKYISSHRLRLGAAYLYQARNSTVPGGGFDNNIFTLRLTGAL